MRLVEAAARLVDRLRGRGRSDVGASMEGEARGRSRSPMALPAISIDEAIGVHRAGGGDAAGAARRRDGYRSTPRISDSMIPSPKYATSTLMSIMPMVGITLRSGARNHSVSTKLQRHHLE